MVLSNRPITYFYTESNLIEPVTPNNLLLGRNLLYTSTEHFVATKYVTEYGNSVKLKIDVIIRSN